MKKILYASTYVILALAIANVVSCLSAPESPTPTKAPATAPSSATPTAISAPTQPAAAAPIPLSTVKLKVGTLSILSDAGLYIAQEKGYFKYPG